MTTTAEVLLLTASGVGAVPAGGVRGQFVCRASFATHKDRRGRRVFDPFFCSLPKAERREWLEDKASLGLTHMLLVRKYAYDRYTANTGIGARDVPEQEFVDLLGEVIDFGMFPKVWLPFDDDAHGQDAVYDGRMAREAQLIKPLVDRLGGVCPAWEIPGAWTSKAIADAGKLLRRELPTAWLILHGRDNERFTGASYHGEGPESGTPRGMRWLDYRDSDRPGLGAFIEADDPAPGDEPGWWYVDGADQFNEFDWESRHGSDGPSFSDGDPNPNSGTWLGRFLEGYERFAPPGTPMPALRRNVREAGAPDWFHKPRAAGRPVCCPFELQEYEYVKGECDDAQPTRIANRLASFGVTTFGSGVPTEGN